MKDEDDRYPNRPGSVANSDTSEAAADSLDDDLLSRMRRQCLDYITARPQLGATCDEIEVALGMRHQTASARLRELELAGRIEKTSYRRPTRSGRGAQVYLLPRAT
jgi:predicted Rossmann fold nucleotide-binding protein DprA/Smf involved in DNA uptake